MVAGLIAFLAGVGFVRATANGPFHVLESQIYSADGSYVTYAGVNWPGAEAVMVPEGLQYQAVQDIVHKISSLGMNAVRLTYATEMIDQIYNHGMVDVPISSSFVKALGQENGTTVFGKVLEKNPTFPSDITHIQASSFVNSATRPSAQCATDEMIFEQVADISIGL